MESTFVAPSGTTTPGVYDVQPGGIEVQPGGMDVHPGGIDVQPGYLAPVFTSGADVDGLGGRVDAGVEIVLLGDVVGDGAAATGVLVTLLWEMGDIVTTSGADVVAIGAFVSIVEGAVVMVGVAVVTEGIAVVMLGVALVTVGAFVFVLGGTVTNFVDPVEPESPRDAALYRAHERVRPSSMVTVGSFASASAWLITASFTSNSDNHALEILPPVTIASFDKISSHSSWINVFVRAKPLIGDTGII